MLTDVNAPDNGGEYICAAMNDAGIGISTSTLYFLPEFIQQPESVTIDTLNDTATLRCRAEAFPLPTYQWQKRISGQFVNLPGENGEVLMENDTLHEDAGVYRCVVTNIINGVPNVIVSRSAIVHGIRLM